MFVQERLVFRHATRDGEVAEALTVACLCGVIIWVEAHRAEIANLVGVVMPAEVVTFGKTRVLLVPAQIAPPF